jgi:glucosamine--fructose-6-phosphate aminotransferase (isomerizing)
MIGRLNMLLESFLYREIHEQPAVMQRVLDRELPNIERLVAAMREHQIEHVVIAARGTSDNAARYAQYLLGAVNGLLVTLATPSLFLLYQRPPRLGRALVLGISQSGRSPDIVAVLHEGRRQGVLTAAITNVPDSPLAQAADVVLNLQAGVEQAVAATKTYTSQLTLIAMLSAALAADQAMKAVLQQLPAFVTTTLEQAEAIGQHAQRYRFMQHCVVIGRGYNYATAFELALKLKELTYSSVEPYSSADFLHGPLALVEPGFPMIVVAPSGVLLPEMQQFIATVKDRGADVVVISDSAETLALGQVPLTLPAGIPEWLSPLVAIVPGQLLALHIAHSRGYDFDQPRGIRKVTETR